MRVFIGNYEFGMKYKENKLKNDENFYEKFLYCYKTFFIWQIIYKNSLRIYKLREFINLNPFQRLSLMNEAKSIGIEFDFISNVTKTLIKSNCRNLKILMRLFSLVKIFGNYYLLSIEQINDLLKTSELIFINFDNFVERNEESLNVIKLFIKITKILIYFSFFLNDNLLMKNISEYYENLKIENSDVKKTVEKIRKNFIYFDSELSRIINKNTIHITKYFEIEFQKYKNEKNKHEKKNVILKKNLMKLLNLLEILINLSFAKHDIYSSGLKRLINNKSKEMSEFLLYEKFRNNVLLGKINQEEAIINRKLCDFYVDYVNPKEIISFFNDSLNNILRLIGVNEKIIKEKNNDEENETFSFDEIEFEYKKGKKNLLVRNFQKKNSFVSISNKNNNNLNNNFNNNNLNLNNNNFNNNLNNNNLNLNNNINNLNLNNNLNNNNFNNNNLNNNNLNNNFNNINNDNNNIINNNSNNNIIINNNSNNFNNIENEDEFDDENDITIINFYDEEEDGIINEINNIKDENIINTESNKNILETETKLLDEEPTTIKLKTTSTLENNQIEEKKSKNKKKIKFKLENNKINKNNNKNNNKNIL